MNNELQTEFYHSSAGSGQAFFLPLQQQFMFTCIPFTTISSKQSELDFISALCLRSVTVNSLKTVNLLKKQPYISSMW